MKKVVNTGRDEAKEDGSFFQVRYEEFIGYTNKRFDRFKELSEKEGEPLNDLFYEEIRNEIEGIKEFGMKNFKLIMILYEETLAMLKRNESKKVIVRLSEKYKSKKKVIISTMIICICLLIFLLCTYFIFRFLFF